MSAIAPAVPDWFLGYLQREYKLIRYAQRQKGPSGPEAVNWPEKYVDTPDGYRDLKVCRALAAVTGSDKDKTDVPLTVQTTYERVKKGDKVKSRSALIKTIGESGKTVVARILEWFSMADFRRDDKNQVLAKNLQNISKAIEQLLGATPPQPGQGRLGPLSMGTPIAFLTRPT